MCGIFCELLRSISRKANYQEWEKQRLCPDGLFWQIDDRDGMEVSIGGSGKRATINSYMYGDVRAIAMIAKNAGKPEVESEYTLKAEKIRKLIEQKLWNPKAQFFKTLPREETATSLVDVRELHGYTPWYFHIPEPNKGYEIAWKQLIDPNGFKAPFGPTTAEQRHPKFAVSYQGHALTITSKSTPSSPRENGIISASIKSPTTASYSPFSTIAPGKNTVKARA